MKCLAIEETGVRMEQTRLGSLIESLMNIAIGYGVALLSQIVVFPLFGIHVPLTTNLWIGYSFNIHCLLSSTERQSGRLRQTHRQGPTLLPTKGGF